MRYTRHELKQDKFTETAAEAVHEVVEHRSGIIRIVAVVVLLALVGSGVYWYMNTREALASDALGRALVTYNAPVVPAGTPPQAALTFNSDQERLIAAKKDFYGVSDKYGWTASGQFARYLAGLTEQQLGNNTVAEEQLRAIGNSHRRELAALAKYALASVYRDEKRDQDAINLLQALSDKPTVTVPKTNAQMAMADIYVSENHPDKAKVIYDQIAKDNTKNSVGEIAKTRLDDLK